MDLSDTLLVKFKFLCYINKHFLFVLLFIRAIGKSKYMIQDGCGRIYSITLQT